VSELPSGDHSSSQHPRRTSLSTCRAGSQCVQLPPWSTVGPTARRELGSDDCEEWDWNENSRRPAFDEDGGRSWLDRRCTMSSSPDNDLSTSAENITNEYNHDDDNINN